MERPGGNLICLFPISHSFWFHLKPLKAQFFVRRWKIIYSQAWCWKSASHNRAIGEHEKESLANTNDAGRMQPAVIQWKTQMNATVVICMWSDVREEDNHISDSDSHNWQWGVVFFFFSFHATCLVNMRSAWHWNYHNYRLVTTRASHAEHSQYVLAVRAGTLAKLNFVLLTLWKKKTSYSHFS